MKFENKAKMSIEDFRQYIDDEDYEFAYGTIDFISNKANSHRHIYTEEVIKECAPSILGKWIVGEYQNGDMSTHTNNQVIQGIVPKNQEVQYRYDEDGYLIASVDIVLSKLYSDAYKVLREDNYRAVSIEELLAFTEETANYVDGTFDKIVDGFSICAVTILGKKINPSIPNANIQLVQMSEDTIVNAEMEYAKYSKIKKDLKDDNISIILNKLQEISNKLESYKEETMAKNTEIVKCAVSIGDDLWSKIYKALKEKYPKIVGDDWITSKYRIVGIYEEGIEKFVIVEECDDVKKFKIMFTLTETELELSDELVEVTVDFVEIGQMEMFTKEEFSKYEETFKPIEEELIEEEMACGDAEKLAELETKLSETEAKLSAYETEIAELKEFKLSVLDEKKESIITSVMSRVKNLVSAETYAQYEESGNACQYENIGSWKNEVLASITDMALEKMSELTKEDGIMEMGIPTVNSEQTKNKSIFD